MADFTFLFNRKGAIYPLDLSSSSSNRMVFNSSSSRQSSPSNGADTAHMTARLAMLNNEWPFNNLLDSTLVHLCAKVIVNMPPKQLDQITDNIPAELFVPLFKATLYPVRDNAIDVNILFFPHKS